MFHLLLPLLALPGPATPQQKNTAAEERLREAPFRVLDNVEGDDIDLLNYPLRPLLVAPDGLWALNTHNSEVVSFIGLSGAPSRLHPVPWNPVALEYWISPLDSHRELLVVSRGTHGLTRLAPVTGEILGYLQLPAEPGDALRVGNHLFVACSALDQVVEVDLLTNTIWQTYEIDTTRHLLFLSADGLGNVLVTPLLSGNNTMPRRTAVAGEFANDPGGNVLDMTNPALADLALPDEDVFRVVPGATPGAGHVEVAATGVGTMLFAHGVNPVTGQLWVLNTQSVNADPVLDSEPEVKGLFSQNRLTLVDLPPVGGPPATVHTFVSLDSVPPVPLGKPYQLSFGSNGAAVIIGALTDNVSVLAANGAHLASFDLPEGSIPRGVLFHESAQRLYVLNWGTNLIQVRATNQPGLPILATLDLGYDPTSPLRKQGRQIFYDGHNSLLDNLSCESCHVEGLFDHLTWNLSDFPVDDKGALFTQSLKGIEFTKPYHWRGERELADFNGAFPGLLGGASLDEQEFAAFEEFVFGLQNPANPFEDPRRVLNDRRTLGFEFDTHDGLSAVRGQELYLHEPSVGTASCNGCHTLPTGTNNDFFPDEAGDTAHRNTFKNTAFNGLWRKEQKTRVTVKERFRPAELRPPLGAGASHAGLANGVFEFNLQNFDLAEEDEQDIALFVHQIDQGLAPAVHRAVLIAPANPQPAALAEYFMPQARARNCDLVVLGRVNLGAGAQSLRWFWDRELRLFRSEDADLVPQPLAFFVAQAQAGTGKNLLVALPVGMGRRFAVDPDNDLLFRQDEAQLGANSRDADSDDDGFLDGTERRFGSNPISAASVPSTAEVPAVTLVKKHFHTARVAKWTVAADRPVTLRVDYASSLGDVGVFLEDAEFKTLWEVALRDLEPSNANAGVLRVYSGTITVTDEFGHTDTAPLAPFQTLSFTDAMESGVANPIELETVLRDLVFVSAAPAGAGGYDLTYRARIEDRKRASSPLAGHAVVARVLRNGDVETVIDMNGGPPADELGSQFGAGDEYGGFGGAGPFVVGSLSVADGLSTLTFRLPNALAGDQVRLSIEMAGRPADAGTFDPTLPLFDDASLFDLANTPAQFRATTPVTLP